MPTLERHPRMRPRLHRREEFATERFLPAPPALLLREPDRVTSPVLRIVLERAREGSRPHARDDGHVVCLAIEGGGMRGAVSAGMCVVLEAMGLVGAFDRIYGVSAGAMNACATAAGQAALSATHYQDAASRGVINRMRPLLRRPVVDLDRLFDEVISARKPLSYDALASGPDFRALAVSLETLSLRVLQRFTTIDEAMAAVRASGSLPWFGGPPHVFRGERMTDGGVIEPIPFETALREGASHVLVLRSRPAGYRKPPLKAFSDMLALRAAPELVPLVKDAHGAYNRQAGELERASVGGDGHLLQVAVPDHADLIARLEANGQRVIEALRAGAQAMASAVLAAPIDLCWQPVVYATAPMQLAPERAGSPEGLMRGSMRGSIVPAAV
ncbi:MAG TPA: patatin-like phospholipase family protein [Solirubrobacteraceae bacterium]|nr:patatin-like phospholipase family protein [Solirubrobacteraceae bacterium]